MKSRDNDDPTAYPLSKKLVLIASAPFQLRLGPTLRYLLATNPGDAVGWISRTRDIAIYLVVLVLIGYFINPEPLRLLVESFR